MKGRQGFTVIELMIVIAILGIFFAIVLPSFFGSDKSAKDIQEDEVTIEEEVEM